MHLSLVAPLLFADCTYLFRWLHPYTLLVVLTYFTGCTLYTLLVVLTYFAGCTLALCWLYLPISLVAPLHCAGCTYLFHWLYLIPCWLYLPISLVAPLHCASYRDHWLHPAGCTYLFRWLHPCRPAHSEPGCRYSLCKLWQQWRHLQ